MHTAHDPIPGKAEPSPGAAFGGNGDEVAVAPEGVGVVWGGVGGALEAVGEVMETGFGGGGGGHCGGRGVRSMGLMRLRRRGREGGRCRAEGLHLRAGTMA